jgi:hypothetical protein
MLRHFLSFSRLSPDEFVALAREEPEAGRDGLPYRMSSSERRK